ncbi:hypothetical protein VCUG_01185 [Vavraia culicis subsp. floridensis]|uniref:Uncharacterized protein n=1 Tax=Vavraia culicis (isolate floridensis) TaxID=948595 RepID=L2GUF3_VAVCU|nr:uncharacterized protein VCUG_01185 [Vavraia culicis subsp. floridensis]ELA47301.2 hypothetical protein VCUG_01185 [Vavraia culicis subsp. floridensis]
MRSEIGGAAVTGKVQGYCHCKTEWQVKGRSLAADCSLDVMNSAIVVHRSNHYGRCNPQQTALKG